MMQKKSTGLVVLVGLAVVAGVVLAERINAQGGRRGGCCVACVDVVAIVNGYQRQKDLTDEMSGLENAFKAENDNRMNRLDQADAVLASLAPDDPTYIERARELLELQVDYRNWGTLTQAHMAREVSMWTVRIYRELEEAISVIAQQEGYDLVLYKGQFEPGSFEPEVIREQIRQRKVLYAHPAVDLTELVLDKLNADYRQQPREKMMYVPTISDAEKP